VPAFLPETIEARRPRALQPVHPFDQVRLGRLDGEVVMIAHEHIRVHMPAHQIARLAKCFEKRLGFADGEEKIAAVIAAIDDVIDRSGKLDAQPASHGGEAGSGRVAGQCNMQQPDPVGLGAPIVAAVDDLVNGVGKFDAQLAAIVGKLRASEAEPGELSN